MATITTVLVRQSIQNTFHGEKISWETEDGHLMVWDGENLVAEFSPGSWLSIIKINRPEISDESVNVQMSSLPGNKMQ